MTRLNIRPRRAAVALLLSSLVLAAPLAGAAGAPAASGTVHVSIGFKPGAEAAMRAAIAKAGGRVVSEFPEVNAVGIDLPRRAFAGLKKSAYARFIEEDVPRYPLGTVTPAAGSQVTPYGITMVQADQVSDAVAGDRTLCIVDSGIDGAHEDHQGNRLSGVNLTTSGEWNTDEAHHGTHVAGTIAAVDNSIGVVGVMPHTNINLFIAKVFDASGSAPSSTIAKAMLQCRKVGHANVISMSLGGSSASQLEQAVTTFLSKLNVLIIAAAGNNGDGTVSYPAGFAEVVSVAAVDSNMAHASFSQFNPDVELSAPGVHVLSTIPMGTGIDSSLTVGGTPVNSLPMTGSPLATATAPLYNYGTAEVSDPGVAGKMCLIQRGNISFAQKVLNCQADGGVGAIIYNNTTGDLNGTLGTTVTTIPSIGITQDDGATLVTMVGTSATLALTASNYAYFDGTSMATPHVSAVAALVWSHHRSCSAAQIRASLDNSALDLGDLGRDDYFGYGLVQAKAADDRITSLGCGN